MGNRGVAKGECNKKWQFVRKDMGSMRDEKTGQEEEETHRARKRNCPPGTLQFLPL